MDDLMQKLQAAADYIKAQISNPQAKLGIILGSGLGNLTEEIVVEKTVAYHEIPHFPVSTVKGHGGKLMYGTLNGEKVLVMSGRFHFYEGYTPQQVVFPVRVMKMLGIEVLILSNAAGSVNAAYAVGDLMIINDHISFFQPNPLIGKNEEALGTRFPDMTEPYDKELIKKAKAIGNQINIQLHEGVYCGVTGPTFETKAEYRLIKAVGGDVVGMSTVQENIAAVHCGLKVFAISVVTDIGIRTEDNVITHEEVLQAAKAAEPKLTQLIKQLVKEI